MLDIVITIFITTSSFWKPELGGNTLGTCQESGVSLWS